MKIALCFSGQPRSVRSGYEYYKKNILSDNVDVYAHLWKSDEVEIFGKLYQPKSIKVQKQLLGSYSEYKNTPNATKYPQRFTYSMFFSMFMCRKLLVESGIKYDWVIRTRTDYAMNVVIPFSSLDPTLMYIPNCRMVPTRDFGNDQFAFSNMKNMVQYMNTFVNIDEYYKRGTQFIGEDMMSANLHKYNLYGERLVYVDMNNPFPPGKHNGTPHSLIRDDYDKWTKKD
jgi:hypothetical protein